MAEIVLFSAFAPSSGFELWRSDGTSAGTFIVREIGAGGTSGEPYALAPAGDRVLFFAVDPDTSGSYALWRSDGTSAGTVPLGPMDTAASRLAVVDGTAYFVGTDASRGAEPWVAAGDGASAGLLLDIRSGPAGSNPGPFVEFGGAAYFAADDGSRRGLWRTDGTSAGTVLAAPVDIAADSLPGAMAVADGTLYFAATDASHGLELWRSDGTSAGTALAFDVVPGTLGSSPRSLAALGDALLFTAEDASHGAELWLWDGTTAGLLADLQPGADGSDPANAVAVGGLVFFTADNAAFGRELWRTDGTSEGTVQVLDIASGPAGSSPLALTAVGDRLFFRANDGSHGSELWVSDGSASGTFMVRDIHPGGSGAPDWLAVLDEPPQDDHDTVPPDTSIAVGPPPVGEATTATFDLAADEPGAHFEAALDGGTWAAAADPLTLSGLAVGAHSLAVRAIDEAGNVDPTPVQYAWTVVAPAPDTTPPETTILAGPAETEAPTTALFDFAADETGATFEVSLDGGPWISVPDPLTVAGLAAGPHTLLARARDAVGNVDESPADWAWTVGPGGAPGGAEPPDTTILAGPALTTPATLALFDLAGGQSAVRYEARLDAGEWAPASDPLVLLGLAAGAHTLAVRAVDLAGKADETPAVHAWSVAPPAVVPDPGPAPIVGGVARDVRVFSEVDAIVPEDLVEWLRTHDSLRLPDFVRNLTLLGADELNGDGNALANVMVGNAAANVLVAYAGNDSVLGLGGDDLLAVGTGDDTVLGDGSADSVAGDDTVWGGQGADSIDGGGGRDLLNGDRGADHVRGGGGDDLVNGGADDDDLDGGTGADTLRGGQGADRIVGSGGTDVLAGDAGADTLTGGAAGGAGDGAADLFVATADGEMDVVTDFEVGIDRVQIEAPTGIIGMASFHDRATDTGVGLLIDLGGASRLLLLGVAEADVTIADLLIV
ncbi:MAG: hypothetical protein IT561_06495 [Alphaproteobacteria bacterium]|nr:hypothetical protein [Alphaproteobacteria bacterium]